MHKSRRTRGQLYHFNCNLLRIFHHLTPEGLGKLAETDEGAALTVIEHLFTYYRRQDTGGWLIRNPEEYERCDDPEQWTPFRYKPDHLRQRRAVTVTPEYARLLSALQDSYRPECDRFLSVLVELGSLDDMKRIRALAKQIAGQSPAYCKVERPAKAKALRHHLHLLVLATPETVIPQEVEGYAVKVQEIGQGQYADQPILANVDAFLQYLHKPYDCRIFAKGKNAKNLNRLLLEDFLGFDPSLARQPTPTRRWGLNLS